MGIIWAYVGYLAIFLPYKEDNVAAIVSRIFVLGGLMGYPSVILVVFASGFFVAVHLRRVFMLLRNECLEKVALRKAEAEEAEKRKFTIQLMAVISDKSAMAVIEESNESDSSESDSDSKVQASSNMPSIEVDNPDSEEKFTRKPPVASVTKVQKNNRIVPDSIFPSIVKNIDVSILNNTDAGFGENNYLDVSHVHEDSTMKLKGRQRYYPE